MSFALVVIAMLDTAVLFVVTAQPLTRYSPGWRRRAALSIVAAAELSIILAAVKLGMMI